VQFSGSESLADKSRLRVCYSIAIFGVCNYETVTVPLLKSVARKRIMKTVIE
jgi:hypothetical protein